MCDAGIFGLKYVRDLYLKKEYEKILDLRNTDDHNILFYVGRTYKDLKQYDNAIECLINYIDRVVQLFGESQENQEKELLLSAYFNLGELYYYKKDFEKAVLNFKICLDLTDNSHINAYQYIIELEPEVAKERIHLVLSEKKQFSDNYLTWVPPGHYYSPIPEIEDIKKYEEDVFSDSKNAIDAININEIEQLELFEELKRFYNDQPFTDVKQEGIRYYFSNDFFLYTDAIILYSMIRFLEPRKIIEVGSGFSSAVILDTNEKFFSNKIECTFIEPYPERLLSILKEDDLQRNCLVSSRLQDLDDEIFQSLSEGDILFIDSSHVSKINSDVNRIFFSILPKLKKGVIIHFHDVFYPFEYPKEWIYEGRAWNEAYVLRAFLQYNNAFKIRFFNNFFAKYHRDILVKDMPICVKNTGGSIWIEKVG